MLFSVMHALDPTLPAAIVDGRSSAAMPVAAVHCEHCETCRLPGDARILLIPDRSNVAAQIRNRRYDRLAGAVVVGPSSQPLTLKIDGVAPVEIAINALDWARLTTVSAATLADRIIPAADLGMRLDGLIADDTGPPIDAVAVADAAADTVADTLIARLAEAITRRPAHGLDMVDEPVVRGLMALIEDGTVFDAATAAERIGTTPHLLRRVALRWFGFPPKTLLMRRRFLAALAQFGASNMDFASVASLGYYDASHFLRDANRFLGTTPRRYLRRIDAAAHRE